MAPHQSELTSSQPPFPPSQRDNLLQSIVDEMVRLSDEESISLPKAFSRLALTWMGDDSDGVERVRFVPFSMGRPMISASLRDRKHTMHRLKLRWRKHCSWTGALERQGGLFAYVRGAVS